MVDTGPSVEEQNPGKRRQKQKSSAYTDYHAPIKIIKTMEESQQLGWALFGCFEQFCHPRTIVGNAPMRFSLSNNLVQQVS
jgi:hypothetical protein